MKKFAQDYLPEQAQDKCKHNFGATIEEDGPNAAGHRPSQSRTKYRH